MNTVEYVTGPAQEPVAMYPYPHEPLPPRHGSDGLPASLVERLLGEDWRPALRVAVPTVLATLAVAALSRLPQLLSDAQISRGLIGDAAPRTTGSFFHGVAGAVATAFGSPTHDTIDRYAVHTTTWDVPLGVTLAAAAVFVLLLRRCGADRTRSQRVLLAARAALLSTGLVVLLSLFGTVRGRLPLQDVPLTATTTVSPGWAALGAGALFTVLGVVTSVRPLEWLQERTGLMRREEWYPAWVGALAATATALVLGLAVLVAAAFDRVPRRGDTARLLPAAVAHLGDLGTIGWNAALLGRFDRRVSGSSRYHDHVSLLARHGLSGWYFAVLLLPALSVAAGALAIRRYRGAVHPRVLSRCCYRMAVPVAGLFAVLAIAGTDHERGAGSQFRSGPQVLAGTALVFGWYLLLGFVAGRVLLARLQESAPSRHAAGATATEYLGGGPVQPPGEWRPSRPVPVPSRAGRLPAIVAAAVTVALAATAAAAVLRHGGRDAVRAAPDFGLTFVIPRSSDNGSSADGGSSSDGGSAAEDDEARATLRDLAAAEDQYHNDNATFAADDTDLIGYVEPDDVSVVIAYADDTSFCATASGNDSDNYFTYDSSDGVVRDGDNC